MLGVSLGLLSRVAVGRGASLKDLTSAMDPEMGLPRFGLAKFYLLDNWG